MKTENKKIPSQMDGLPLGVLVCYPEEPPVAIVQCCHGMCEHKERYLPFLEYLCGLGYLCVIHDHRGHGESIRAPEDLGYFYENGAQAAVEDVHQINQWIREQYPKISLFLIGHSMGSLIVRCYVKKYDDTVQGLIVCGSPSKNPATKVGLRLTRFLSKRRGDRYISRRIHRLVLGSFNRKFTDVQSENDWICSSRQTVAAYDNDPLCGFVFTLNGFENLFLLMDETYNSDGWGMKNPNLPVWFLSGEDDPCMLNWEKFMEAVNFMKKVGYTEVDSKAYLGMRHEILKELDQQLVFEDIAAKLHSWL